MGGDGRGGPRSMGAGGAQLRRRVARWRDMRIPPALVALSLLVVPVIAQSLPPLPRERPAVTAQAGPAVPLPRERPEAAQPDVPKAAPENPPPSEAPGEEGQPPEKAEAPPRVFQSACPAVIMGLVEAKALPPISEGQCGERSPLEVTGVLVNGRMVPLSAPATLTCEMASALPQWLTQVDGYLGTRDNTRIERMEVSTSYMCRNVNGSGAGRLSEHAFANGLDVMGFRLEDGRTIDVESAWPGTEEQGSRIVRHAHDSACAVFTTTLGPEANAEHHNHLHVDMGCHGKTCTARLCE